MERIRVLPSENGRESHYLFESTHLLRAIELFVQGNLESASMHVSRAREWPERLGQGKPYEVDTRLADYISFRIAKAEGRDADADRFSQMILLKTGSDFTSASPLNQLAADVLIRNGFAADGQAMLEKAKAGLEAVPFDLTHILVDQATKMEISQ